MRETSIRSPGANTEQPLPQDATEYQATSSYTAYLSRAERGLIIETDSYHPRLLHIPKEDLERVLADLET